ncbi:MAG: hypothetical protein F4171_04695 [Gammaproteobacteria bacterium]|nr:hypothetical protein [Gammaproteobacteria bacterium]MYE84746.1 hypothetical protein [Gammaproteobacteria bacterium]MYG12075.1 hypothetical protein [Gammaproteobacteria bacterium]MYH16750.1 hypothetical protein [Gammaproteobacteria bacterium]MYK27692.1 hypothetical protein [Gammaproteobacteria bacterium]
MAGYKGYEIQYGEKSGGWIVSPVGERIAIFHHTMGDSAPILASLVNGIDVDKGYPSLNAAVRDIADQHIALTSDASDDPILSSGEARVVITGTVENLQLNQNSIGIQITPTQVEDINKEIDRATPSLLRKVLKEWIPQACTKEGVGLLLAMLGLAAS